MTELDRDPEKSNTIKAFTWQEVYMLPDEELKNTFNSSAIVYHHNKLADSCHFKVACNGILDEDTALSVAVI